MTVSTRFAPSPTGNLHIGNIRTAILNYVFAKKSGGKFILRLDDTDKDRSTQEYVDQIKRDLEWLGIEWDKCERQSDKLDQYREVVKKLCISEDVYECFETKDELELKRKKQLSIGKPPVYDRAALRLTKSEIMQMRRDRPSHWRYKLGRKKVTWTDTILGPVSIDTSSVSDPVVIRGDGQFLYTIASVVDDISMDINHVIRGSDHVTNTAVQIEIIEKLGSLVPVFCHHSLLVGARGEPLSKRLNALSIKDLRSQGLEPKAIFAFMAQLGSSGLINNQASINTIKQNFSLDKFGVAPTKFEFELLLSVSRKHLSLLDFSDINSYLTALEIPSDLQQDFWEMAKDNISTRSDLDLFWDLCRNGASTIVLDEDKAFIKVCKDLMPPFPHDKNSWAEWTSAIKLKTNRSGKRLFLPLRKALTGAEHGPDMNKLFPLLQRIDL